MSYLLTLYRDAELTLATTEPVLPPDQLAPLQDALALAERLRCWRASNRRWSPPKPKRALPATPRDTSLARRARRPKPRRRWPTACRTSPPSRPRSATNCARR